MELGSKDDVITLTGVMLCFDPPCSRCCYPVCGSRRLSILRSSARRNGDFPNAQKLPRGRGHMPDRYGINHRRRSPHRITAA